VCFEAFVCFRFFIKKSMESDCALRINPTIGMNSFELKLLFLLHLLINSIAFITKNHLINSTLFHFYFCILFFGINLYGLNDFKQKTITIAFYYYR
jgi:hypothetical protein